MKYRYINYRNFTFYLFTSQQNATNSITLISSSCTMQIVTQNTTFIKHFSRLLGGRTKHHGDTYVCNSCLNVFSSQTILDEHIPNCLRHNPQMVVYPDTTNDNECKLKFKDTQKQHPLRFYLVCDFESFLVPNTTDQTQSNTKTHIVDEHNVSGFCCHRVTDIPQFQVPPTLYRGPDVMSHFYDHIMTESGH